MILFLNLQYFRVEIINITTKNQVKLLSSSQNYVKSSKESKNNKLIISKLGQFFGSNHVYAKVFDQILA